MSGLPLGVLSHLVTSVKFGASPQVTKPATPTDTTRANPRRPSCPPPFNAMSCFADARGPLDVPLQDARVPGHVLLQEVERVRRDADRHQEQHDATDLSIERRALTNGLHAMDQSAAGEGDEEQRHDRADGEERA